LFSTILIAPEMEEFEKFDWKLDMSWRKVSQRAPQTEIP
jgi:hypothetical protein